MHAIIKIEYFDRVPFGAAVDGSAAMCMVEFNKKKLTSQKQEHVHAHSSSSACLSWLE